ncbi:putative toxin-antitoxin system toxin component, PIN family [Methylomonas paludis]|uniref:Toxin-antitoxin system toxin component, PIN family n=1 Tax=Methylomonas paludis TaxID=1173101 RepID=A0A975MPY0_9GAMM|nr:putative toxin-antitoxin system toxin component, PIN family [Methylomonas paludis]QWF71351.1 putative toxin-antitoxin system toxin component, PIN family [Methylomonas paludis]
MPIAETKRIVVDTSLAISAAILPNSISAKAFSLALKKFQIVASDSTLAELVDVIYRQKFNKYLSDEARLEFLTLYAQSSEIVSVTSVITDCIDPKDNQFLALAIDAGASFILSGDPHLTGMNPYRGVAIVGPKYIVDKFK